jgi:hypothetical protein
MLEIFAPYMLFISFILTVLFNLWLISKNIHWILIIIANLLLILVMEFFNLAEYNFLNKIVEWIFDFIAGIISEFWDLTFGRLIKAIKEFLGIPTEPTTGGGGGGFHSR